MNNARNSRTTHPRKQARRDRAAMRFSVVESRLEDKRYRVAKRAEAIALGMSRSSEWFIATFGAAAA